MQSKKIEIIRQWFAFVFVNEIQQFIKLCNFYRKFIKHFNKIVEFLISMLTNIQYNHERKRKKNIKKTFTKRLSKQFNDFFTSQTYRVFVKLRNVFLKTSIFIHFDSKKFIRVKIDVFNKIIEIIFTQQNNENHWHFVIFVFKKFILAKMNYEIHDKKFLTIVHVFKIWRYYFFEFQHDVLILIDHQNLNRFIITISLSQRQVRWTLKLFKYYFKKNYRSKTKNLTNELFKRSNFMILTNKKIQQNRIILKQFQNSLKRKQIENFATIVRTFSTLIKSTKIRNMN